MHSHSEMLLALHNGHFIELDSLAILLNPSCLNVDSLTEYNPTSTASCLIEYVWDT